MRPLLRASLLSLVLFLTAASPPARADDDGRDLDDASPPNAQISVLAMADPVTQRRDLDSDVIVTASPGQLLGAIQLKVYSAAGRLLRVASREGGRRPVIDLTEPEVSRGERVVVTARVYDPARPRFKGKAVAQAIVKLRPHLTLAAVSAPATLAPGQPGAFVWRVGEDGGDLGATARLTLSDGRSIVAQGTVSVPAGGAAPSTLSASFAAAGAHALTAVLVPLSPVSLRDTDDVQRVVLRSTVTVVTAPSIASFTASPAGPIPAGGSATLRATFSGGAGTVNPGGLAISSGGSVTASPGATTTYSLTVSGPGGSASASVVVQVDAAAAVVGTAGGTLATPGGASLQIPFGALDGPVQVSLQQTTQPVPGGFGAVSPLYELDPVGTLLSRPVLLSLPLPAGVSAGAIYCSVPPGGFTSLGGAVQGGAVQVLVTQLPQLGLCFIGAPATTRTVIGVGQITWLSATLRQSEPIDFAAQGVEALVADGHGGYTSLPGVGGLGTFTIAGVPNGDYLLHSGSQYLVTASSAPDLGSVQGGKPDHLRQPITQSTVLNLNLTNLAPWDPNGWIEFYSTEENDWDFGSQNFGALGPGDTAGQLAIDLSQLDSGPANAILSSQGDHALIGQLATVTSDTGVPYLALTRAALLAPFDLPDGATASQDVALHDVSLGEAISFDYKGSQFVGLLDQDGFPGHSAGCGFCGGNVMVLAQPGDAEDGFYSANADPLIYNDGSGTDVQSGVMRYGSPQGAGLAGSWGLLVDARWIKQTHIVPLPGAPQGPGQSRFNDSIDWTTNLATAQAVPITPPLSLPRHPTLNGADFYTSAGNIGTTPTLAWGAPAVGQPDFYRVGVLQLFVNGFHRTAARRVAAISTTQTSFTLPPGILQDGQAYVFAIEAVMATSPTAAFLASAPFKSSIDVASGHTSSNSFWVGAAPSPGPQVSVIQDGQLYPWGLTTTANGVYWVERHDSPWDGSGDSGLGAVWTAGLDGSNPHVLAAGQHQPMGIAADETSVYWTNAGDGTVRKLDLATSAVTLVAGGQGTPGTAITLDNGSLYWFGQGLQALYAGQPAPTFLGWYGGVNLASDGSNLYWTDYGNYPDAPGGQVWSLPVTGGAATSLVAGQAQSWDVQVGGGVVYWSDQAWQQAFPASIQGVPSGGGAPFTVATGLGPNSEILKVFAIDGTRAYYVDSGTLYTASLAGGAPQVLAQLPSGGCPEGKMAVRGNNVYWTDTCNQSVMRVSW